MTYKSIEITVVITASILQTVNVQMMFPAQQMFMMPAPPPMAVQVMPPPPPMGVPVPYPVPVPVIVTKKTTTTTTTKAPSREEKEENNNMMVFGGNPFAPPVIVMPIPPSNVRQVEYDETSEDESRSDDSSDSSRSALRTRKKHRQHHTIRTGPKRKHHLRTSGHGQKHHENHQKQLRNKRNLGFGDPNFIRPVLTYISKRGNVKFKRRISGDDAARLMGMKRMNSDEEEESSDTSQSHSPREISGLRLIQSTERTRGIGTLPDKRVSNISISYRLY